MTLSPQCYHSFILSPPHTHTSGVSPAACPTMTAIKPRAPCEKPSFSFYDVKKAVPKHCFQRSALRSSLYLVCDLAGLAVLVVLSSGIDTANVVGAVRWGVLWPLYWFWAGAFGTGLWVIAHECGHGAFSESSRLNDCVGLILHSTLMVPYYSW